MRIPRKSHIHPGETMIGSLSQIHGDGCIILHTHTGTKVDRVLDTQNIHKKIQCEREAWKTICILRDRCMKPPKHNPTKQEIETFTSALRTLLLLLPPIKQLPGESNKTFLIRTLHEVGRFRQIDMFSK